MRALLMLATLVAACFINNKFSPHHTATENTIFTTFYMHVTPATLVAPSEHADDAAGEHGAATHGEAAHGEAAHSEAAHGHGAPLVAIPLPGFLKVFDGDPDHEGVQLVLYNLQIFQLAALIMLLLAFSGVPGYLRTGEGDRVSALAAGFCLWVRDDLVEPAMGKHLGQKFLPLLMFVFFFIAAQNLMGLAPMSATPTASIFVTAALALITFAIMLFGGMAAQGPVAFFKHLVPDVPLLLWPLMFVIELAGLFIKPVALMIRLFANMTGGHLVVLSFLALVFFFAAKFETLGMGLSPVWVGFAVFIMIIEAFVALVQAYIFTMLSALFIGASIHPEH
ncbi:MAG: F0F1 ATP synthase subunit A [Planctomycetota bacterium]